MVLKGILIKIINDRFVFRASKEDGTYVDYYIAHHDLQVTIDDDTARIDGDMIVYADV